MPGSIIDQLSRCQFNIFRGSKWAREGNFRYLPLADMPLAAINVRFRGLSGH
jgi:hypothetical protein